MKLTFRKVENLICLAMICLFASCSSGAKDQKQKSLPKSIGQPSEVLLVLDKEVMASDLRDTLKAMLDCDIPGLPRPESYFRVSRVPQSIYKGEMLKMHSKLLVRINPSEPECNVKVAYDVDARPQTQVLLVAPSLESLHGYVQANAERVRRLLLDQQLASQQSFLKRRHSKVVRKALKEMGFDGFLPEEIAWTKKGENFLWGSSRTNEKQLNVVFYHYPSDGSELHNSLILCQKRDSVMQINIPGSMPDQWMETVWEQDIPVVDIYKMRLDEREITEMRGLWQMRNGAMGGPFVAYYWYDSLNGRMVVAEGFVFSPSTDKRDLVRKLEAGLRTVR